MKKKNTLIISSLFFILSGCGISQTTLMRIEKGMNKREIMDLLGNPSYRRFNEKSEEWEYHSSLTSEQEESVIIVQFLNNKVSGMNSYKAAINNYPLVATTSSAPVIGSTFQYQGEVAQTASDIIIEQLYQKVKLEPFKEDKIKLLKIGIINKSITCAQCIRLLSLATFGDDKLEILQLLAPHVVDRENYQKVIKTLPFTYWEESEKFFLLK